MKKGLKVLLLASAFITLSAGMLGPIYALFVESIGGDILDASFAYFAYMLSAGIVVFIISKWENRVLHKEKLIFWGYVLNSIGMASYLFVYNQTTLLLTQGILGISLAIISPAFDSLYAHYTTKKEEASDWGSWEAMGYIVTALAALTGGLIADFLGFQMLFLIMFALSVLGMVQTLELFREKKILNK